MEQEDLIKDIESGQVQEEIPESAPQNAQQLMPEQPEQIIKPKKKRSLSQNMTIISYIILAIMALIIGFGLLIGNYLQ
ncbi:hypothetical protein COZ55_00935 [archaeon CG_4_8_14_3_um_filter_38_5]|nr:MAG: hypothetical protein COS83_02600 [archaeon CG07_land_8_20_14_0_80_38_8]PIX43760.1 MAG: hypothetical protein COZ55_00935 [archaeon CG_4_8_14_3_um_filter_38_5]